MTDERERHDGGDPVEDFFARARAEIRAEPADDLRWQRIVREGQRGRRSRWLATVGGVAAAGVVAATLGFGPQVVDRLQGQQQGGVTAATQGRSATSAPSPPALRSSPPSSSTSNSPDTRQGTAPAVTPGTFTSGSLTNAGQHRLYLLGTSDCGSTSCPVLLTSPDNGATWQRQHTFAPDEAWLDQVRFANPQVGWAYGASTIKVTRDGGQTWSDFTAPGETVLDLESNGSDVVIASSTGCTSGTCSGPLRVSRAPIGGAKATPVAQGPSGVRGAQIQTSKHYTLVNPEWAATERGSGPWRLDGQQLVPLWGAGQGVCGVKGAGTVDVGANPPERFGSICGGTGSQLDVSTSDNGGVSWTRQSRTGLSLPGTGAPLLAVASRSHLVAARGDSLQVSVNAGRTWHAPATPPKTSAKGWQWVAAPGGTQFYAISRDGHGYWVSGDWGEHWEHVVPKV